MKFICLGYLEERKWDEMSEAEHASFMEECFAYDDELHRGGHFISGEALQSTRNVVTLRCRHGKVTVTDGPHTETKEQLGGILFLEARDLNHAIQLMSNHPGIRAGCFEIRAADEELNALVADRQTSYQDIIEFVSDDHRILKSQILEDNGKWNHFMTAHYRRRK